MMGTATHRLLGLVACLGLWVALGAGCTGSFSHLGTTSRLLVDFAKNPDGSPQSNIGSKAVPLPLTFDGSAPILLDITAVTADGQVDPQFNRYVRLSVKPGTVVNLSGQDTDGRNVRLHN